MFAGLFRGGDSRKPFHADNRVRDAAPAEQDAVRPRLHFKRKKPPVYFRKFRRRNYVRAHSHRLQVIHFDPRAYRQSSRRKVRSHGH